jgi:hypothetical protein
MLAGDDSGAKLCREEIAGWRFDVLSFPSIYLNILHYFLATPGTILARRSPE